MDLGRRQLDGALSADRKNATDGRRSNDHTARNYPSPSELAAYLMEGLTMQMQIDTHKGDPAEDRGAFLGGVLWCVVLLAALLAAHMLQ